MHMTAGLGWAGLGWCGNRHRHSVSASVATFGYICFFRFAAVWRGRGRGSYGECCGRWGQSSDCLLKPGSWRDNICPPRPGRRVSWGEGEGVSPARVVWSSVVSRASNEGSQRFLNHREGPYFSWLKASTRLALSHLRHNAI